MNKENIIKNSGPIIGFTIGSIISSYLFDSNEIAMWLGLVVGYLYGFYQNK
jgi:hypothetical protein